MNFKAQANLPFTFSEQQALLKLLDELLRHSGITHLQNVQHFVEKLESAFTPDTPADTTPS